MCLCSIKTLFISQTLFVLQARTVVVAYERAFSAGWVGLGLGVWLIARE